MKIEKIEELKNEFFKKYGVEPNTVLLSNKDEKELAEEFEEKFMAEKDGLTPLQSALGLSVVQAKFSTVWLLLK